jgi:transcriptional regulator with XRE-family HTH domain
MTLSYGDIIQIRRRKLNMSQEELAKRVGCSRITIGMIERNRQRCSFDLFQKILYELYLKLEIVEEGGAHESN